MPEQSPTPPKPARNPWKTATFCSTGALLATSAALVYAITADGGSKSSSASADPSPSIWQDTRPPADSGPVESPSPSPSQSAGFKVGDEARNGGAVVKITKVREVGAITLDGATKKAGAGAKYVILETVVFNDTKASMDLTCSLPIVNNLVDDQGRRFDTIEDLYEIPGNPECNAELQPGFKDEMQFVYRVPKEAKIATWEFSEFNLSSDPEPSIIQLTSSGKL